MLILIAQAPQVIDIAAGKNVISPIGTVDQLLQIGASAILLIGTLAVLYYLLYGAFSWITAGGEKGKIEEARGMMTQGVVGLIILASVFIIFGMVLNFLGLRDRFNIGGTTNTGTSVLAPIGGGSNNCPVIPVGSTQVCPVGCTCATAN